MDSRTKLISLVGRLVPTVLSKWCAVGSGRKRQRVGRNGTLQQILGNRFCTCDMIKQERETESSREPPEEVIPGTFNTYGSNQDF